MHFSSIITIHIYREEVVLNHGHSSWRKVDNLDISRIAQKRTLKTRAYKEDTDPPAHLRSLIRIFTRIAKDAKYLHADNEDSDQTAWMRSLIRVFVGRTCEKVRFLTLRLILLSLSPSVLGLPFI